MLREIPFKFALEISVPRLLWAKCEDGGIQMDVAWGFVCIYASATDYYKF